jgi:type IV pilus assembly protein PilE
MKSSTGFTLIELMLVVMIIGILMAISIPSYRDYVLRGKRTDGQTALLDIASRQERFVAQNNTYTTLIAEPEGLSMGTTTSQDDQYDMSVAACGGGGTIATCYVITATAVGSQASDTDCATITYDSTGTRSGTTDECW